MRRVVLAARVRQRGEQRGEGDDEHHGEPCLASPGSHREAVDEEREQQAEQEEHEQGQPRREDALEQRQTLRDHPWERQREHVSGNVQPRSQRENHDRSQQERDEAHEPVRPAADDDEEDQRQEGQSDVAAELRRPAEPLEEVRGRPGAELLPVTRHHELEQVEHEHVVRLHGPGHALPAVQLHVKRVRIERQCG